MAKIAPLSAQAITQKIPSSTFSFKSTKTLKPFHGVLGQDRAVNALQFGVAMQRPGYNIFVMGDTGTGRSSYVQDFLKSEAKRQETPSAWCYINNFKNPREPLALEFSADQANTFKELINELIDQLLASFPAVFEHPAYQQKKSAIDYVFNRRYDRAIETVEREAHKRGVAVFRDSSTISFTPINDGKALDETEFAQLSEEEKNAFHNNIGELEQLLSDQLSELPQWKRESSNQLRQLNHETVGNAITPLLKPFHEGFKSHEGVIGYLSQLQEYLPRLIMEELVEERLLEVRDEYIKRNILEDSLLPNIVTFHNEGSGAPVIFEPHPGYANLFGRIEYASDQGTLVTNYRNISPGALHKANGGYLVLDVEKVLTEPLVWEALKRALQSQQLKMESPFSDYGLIHTTTLLPEIIPLNVKLVLVGSRQIYYLLQEYDEDFRRLFRTVVDFDSDLPLTKDYLQAYARLLKHRINEQGYADLTLSAVQLMVRYSAKLADQQDLLSARIGEQFELLAEADFIRKLAGEELIDGHHISRALSAKKERTSRVYDKLFEQMVDGTVLLETQGHATGKINGLTVMSLGDTSFGSPARITATVYPGTLGVVDIEREASLGQAIHSKGVMILSGYLGNRYAQEFPLAVTAHLAMEQSYGYIDGDSASVAELVCLISALIKAPIAQNLAITGSMNQHGEVQAIGGINEKIEGFFRLCDARGLTGDQGVIMPSSNKRNLILNDDVVQAVKDGKFFIYAIDHVDQALELLLQRPAGKIKANGQFTKGSINQDVIDRLREIAEMNKKKAK